MKYFAAILTIIFSVGCSNFSPNQMQINMSLGNLECYLDLVDGIRADTVLKKEIIKIRDSRRSGDFDPVTVKREFRLIDLDEIINSIDSNWVTECRDQVENGDDLRGIRMTDDDLIIIEIDVFDRKTMTERYSRNKTSEFHRLIVGGVRFDRSNFYFGTEHPIWRDTIEEGLIYEVTQLK